MRRSSSSAAASLAARTASSSRLVNHRGVDAVRIDPRSTRPAGSTWHAVGGGDQPRPRTSVSYHRGALLFWVELDKKPKLPSLARRPAGVRRAVLAGERATSTAGRSPSREANSIRSIPRPRHGPAVCPPRRPGGKSPLADAGPMIWLARPFTPSDLPGKVPSDITQALAKGRTHAWARKDLLEG